MTELDWLWGMETYFNFMNESTNAQLSDNLARAMLLLDELPSIIDELRFIENQVSKESFKNVIHCLSNSWNGKLSNDDLLSLLIELTDDEFLRKLYEWKSKMNVQETFNDHMSKGQLQSKIWLIEILETLVADKTLGTVALYGGWHATINWLLHSKFEIDHTVNFELDKNCIKSSSLFNEDVSFEAIKIDVSEIKWLPTQKIDIGAGIEATVVINTSSEHMNDDWFNNLPKDQFVCLQTNDYFDHEQHVNCVNSIDEMKEKYQMSECLYAGELNTYKYTRYMMIGFK